MSLKKTLVCLLFLLGPLSSRAETLSCLSSPGLKICELINSLQASYGGWCMGDSCDRKWVRQMNSANLLVNQLLATPYNQNWIIDTDLGLKAQLASKAICYNRIRVRMSDRSYWIVQNMMRAENVALPLLAELQKRSGIYVVTCRTAAH